MAKKSMIARDVKRKKMVDRFAPKRAALKAAMVSSLLSPPAAARRVTAGDNPLVRTLRVLGFV